ncbi:MAG: sugar phosphate isomerase/epimerase [Thermoprotei archaeon]|nr:MAG: sugar phosphate isomerase/epimerase [Thermoprotei archaeon]
MKLAVVVAPPTAGFEAVVRKPLREALSLLQEYGYDGVELSLLDPKVINRGELRSMLSEYGLELPALSTGLNYLHFGLSLTSPDPAVRKRAVDRLLEFADLAYEFGASVVIGLIRGRSGELSQRSALKLLVGELREICKRASHVEFLLEPLNRYETDLINNVEEALEVLEMVTADNLYLLVDTFHMNIEEPRIEDSIRRAGDRIGHVHVADSNRLAPGMGHLDFKSVINALREVGYNGYLSAEVIVKPDLRTVLEVTRRTLAPLLT